MMAEHMHDPASHLLVSPVTNHMSASKSKDCRICRSDGETFLSLCVRQGGGLIGSITNGDPEDLAAGKTSQVGQQALLVRCQVETADIIMK